jgi:dTDP-4-amino-4,6-dideoxy-D-galactose acyltransferase
LAIQSGEYSRFKTDPNFGISEFERFYKEWIINSVSGKIADGILIYKNNDRIVGMITYKIKDNFCTIGLLAVDRDFRGKSIGKLLIGGLINELTGKNISRLYVVTQKANHAACRFYEKCGFIVDKVENVYHFWI